MPHDQGKKEAQPAEKVDVAPPQPPASEEVSNGLEKSYWLMANGGPVGYKLKVQVNGNGVTTVRRTEAALDLTSHVHPGLNTLTLAQSESGTGGNGQLTLTVGPELSREARGGNQTYIRLKENLIHFIRPAGNRGSDGEVTLRFSIGEAPNPDLTQRYLLYSQGAISGHVIEVSLNGSPLVDIASPGAYCDLNPFLKKGKNEFSFSVKKLPLLSFTADERKALEGKSFEVGVAIVGPYSEDTYDTSVSQLTNIALRYSQPADQEEPEESENLVLNAD